MDAQWLGVVNYANSLEIQRAHAQNCSNLSENEKRLGIVLGLEHTAVITLGKRAQNDRSDILWSEEKLKLSGVEVFSTDRGGLATLHSPGQLVIYPILSLKKLGLSIRDYVHLLETTTLRTLKSYGVAAATIDGLPGVFVGLDKIASIGVRVANRVTSHGLAINISNDLSLFGSIQACGGISRVTSLEKLLSKSTGSLANAIDPEEVFQKWIKEFGSQIQELNSVSQSN